MKLRITSNLSEIKNYFQTWNISHECTLWYYVKKERQIEPIIIQEVNILALRIKIARLKSLHETIGDEIYVKLGENNASFKLKIIELNEFNIIAEVPAEMVLPEFRDHKRWYFTLDDNKKVYLKSTFSDFTQSKKIHQGAVVDISKKGMCLIVSSEFGQSLKKRSKLIVVSLNEQVLDKAVEGEVVNVNKIKSTENKLGGISYKISIKLSELLPENEFQKFILKMNRVDINETHFYQDEEFKTNVKSQVSTVITNLKKKPHLSKFLKNLEINRDDNQYIKNHIDLLCMVSTGLAKYMEWGSEKTIEKLIYASYIHDVAYFTHPELARIKSKREFELIKNNLSAEAIAIYLDGPRFSSDFAKEDNAYTDVDKILLQQKERPDGTGFPFGIKHSSITPLSSLFIVAHVFVDYVIETPEWTNRDFYLKYKSELYGQHFAKIMSFFEVKV